MFKEEYPEDLRYQKLENQIGKEQIQKNDTELPELAVDISQAKGIQK